MNDHRSQSVWVVLILAVTIVSSAAILGGAIRGIKRGSDTITVTGSARRPIRSDYVVWRGSVYSQKTTTPEAYKEVQRYTERLRSYLHDHRVADSSVSWASLDNEQIPEISSAGHPTGRIAAFKLTQRFEVRSNQVDAVSALSRQADELISENVPLASQPLEFLFTRLADVRVEMLAEATKDARLRAQKIAESSGSKIGPVRNARMGVFQITPRNSTEVSDYGIYDTSSLEKDITAVVSLSFSVE